MATSKKKFTGHWSQTPGLRKWLEMCEEGWENANLIQYDTPARAMVNIGKEEKDYLRDSLFYVHPISVQREVNSLISLMEELGLEGDESYSLDTTLALFRHIKVDFLAPLYKRFPNLPR